ncbi:MAG: hypothetical protein IJN61_04860 [Clostridia bacterium]|nr:hypothetical protein [Clostridia bacterium]MBQ7038418.1 hypothetical protein [Clostridia bacterium]
MSKLLLKEVHTEVLPKGNSAAKWNPQKGGADVEAEALRQEILNAEDKLVITGTTYYVSPNGDDSNDGKSPENAWKTLNAVRKHEDIFEAGDGVLFERGGIWRSQITLEATMFNPAVEKPPLPILFRAKSGMSYGAYGTGPKPAIYGSFKNYAWEECWEPTEYDNIWKVETPFADCGVIVFNHGEEAGIKRFMGHHIEKIDDLKKNFEFYHDFVNGILYLYLDKGCPHEVYEDIELCLREDFLFIGQEIENVTVDNLAIKYFGHYGSQIKAKTKNIRFTNCEMGWIGGCVWVYSSYPYSPGARLGNAIEFWDDSEDALMEYNWIYQIFDAGLSPQGISPAGHFKNMVMRKNLLEYSTYNIEFFHRTPGTDWDGYYIEDNIIRFSGYGWGDQRDKSYSTSNICGWTFTYDVSPRIYIRNNIFDCSKYNTVFWHWADGREYPEVEISGNTFYEKDGGTGKAIHYAGNDEMTASNQEELEAAMKAFDSNPKLIKWLP